MRGTFDAEIKQVLGGKAAKPDMKKKAPKDFPFPNRKNKGPKTAAAVSEDTQDGGADEDQEDRFGKVAKKGNPFGKGKK